MKALMIHVEKAVRPLRITQGQRTAIREELYGHLLGIYEEELAASGNQQQAIDAAIKRFGAADEISQKLRETMPWYSAILSRVPWFSRIRSWPESHWRIAWRGWMTGILCWVPLGITWCSLLVFRDRITALKAITLWFLFACLSIVYLVPFVGMVGSLHGMYGLTRSIRRAIYFGLAGCLGQFLIYGLIRWFVRPNMPLAVFTLPVLIPLFTGLLCSTSGFKRLIAGDAEKDQRLAEWEQLTLEE
ncbi:MAG: hypothetical protein KDA74_21810 [Planctomycetaceae bacterium]|nr:hypothetical protein [Planctomycetaceae bacterium]